VLLAFDTATPYVTVALHDGEVVVAAAQSEERMKHGEQLAPLIERVLREAGVARQDVTALAVGTGPGPFTGLRVGLVTARTLSLVLDVPAYGVCTLDAIALEAAAGLGGTSDFVVATDARRKEVYLAAYDEHGTRLSGPVVDRPAHVATDLPVAGEGAVIYPEAFSRPIAPALPSAGWLARAVVEERVELTDAEPRYLRRPDAAVPGDRVSTSSTAERP
jgi:tRNA threonylcarbamoyl adenosine modification protein YeaZ